MLFLFPSEAVMPVWYIDPIKNNEDNVRKHIHYNFYFTNEMHKVLISMVNV